MPDLVSLSGHPLPAPHRHRMSIAPYIKEIGRGKDGARPLNAEQAQDLFSQVLAQRASAAQIGGFCVAMRIKGETSPELQGFWAATQARHMPLPLAMAAASARPGCPGIVILPSYNGARRLPNLTPLLAQVLANQGCAVLVHGLGSDPSRVTSQQVFEAAGLPFAHNDAELANAWAQGQPAYLDIAALNPGLFTLLSMRWELGLRNPGHTIAKLLDPWAGQAGAPPRVRVVNHTHPEYAHSLTQFLIDTGATAMLMRGTEGEPVADARRQPRCDVFIRGQLTAELSLAPQEGVLQALPALPATCDADATASYMRAVQQGAQPCPDAIAAQARALVATLHRAMNAPVSTS
jgi:anthranilate phosphoribosyltransferase